MRQIDADALTEKCGDWYVEEGPEEGFIGTVKSLLDGQPTVQPEPCEDTINRQAAIEIVERYNKSHMVLKQQPMLGAASIVIELEELPSIQPDVIRCKDCVNYIDNRCVVANHHVAPFSCCQSVFQAKNRGEQK